MNIKMVYPLSDKWIVKTVFRNGDGGVEVKYQDYDDEIAATDAYDQIDARTWEDVLDMVKSANKKVTDHI